ncbi:hypothetical protein FN846DRAFT_429434 [Sphaerosporella brunnea]|uniref:Uncharacterized protein n=1 Tax=Sphaerosporella brunnea TaxID=1250544 RepID=A0A5J5EH67_9PEZI|nr:hypothetical protein FN846DRAFT_429434 [Sphaerosporella brunnea]
MGALCVGLSCSEGSNQLHLSPLHPSSDTTVAILTVKALGGVRCRCKAMSVDVYGMGDHSCCGILDNSKTRWYPALFAGFEVVCWTYAEKKTPNHGHHSVSARTLFSTAVKALTRYCLQKYKKCIVSYNINHRPLTRISEAFERFTFTQFTVTLMENQTVASAANASVTKAIAALETTFSLPLVVAVAFLATMTLVLLRGLLDLRTKVRCSLIGNFCWSCYGFLSTTLGCCCYRSTHHCRRRQNPTNCRREGHNDPAFCAPPRVAASRLQAHHMLWHIMTRFCEDPCPACGELW